MEKEKLHKLVKLFDQSLYLVRCGLRNRRFWDEKFSHTFEVSHSVTLVIRVLANSSVYE